MYFNFFVHNLYCPNCKSEKEKEEIFQSVIIISKKNFIKEKSLNLQVISSKDIDSLNTFKSGTFLCLFIFLIES